MEAGTIPKTFAEAIERILTDTPKHDLDIWAALPEEQAVIGTHFFGGRRMRNAWGLWTGSELARNLHDLFGLTHADDMSGLLLRCAHRKANGKEMKPTEIADGYLKHWIERGGIPVVPWADQQPKPLPMTLPMTLREMSEASRRQREDIVKAFGIPVEALKDQKPTVYEQMRKKMRGEDE